MSARQISMDHELQRAPCTGFGNVATHDGRGFASPVPPIGACRGAKPLCIPSLSPKSGGQGVDRHRPRGRLDDQIELESNEHRCYTCLQCPPDEGLAPQRQASPASRESRDIGEEWPRTTTAYSVCPRTPAKTISRKPTESSPCSFTQTRTLGRKPGPTRSSRR